MTADIHYKNKTYKINLLEGIDISLPLQNLKNAASAWYCPPTEISPVVTEHFVGDVNQGGSVNFKNITFNPHGNGTHTECVGHISKEFYSINQCLKRFIFLAQVVSIEPEKIGDDLVITTKQIQAIFNKKEPVEALIIRTMPNLEEKKQRQYSNTNPPYIEAAAMVWLYEQGMRHFLIDTPSVDKEYDDGILAAHHAFWDYPNKPRLDATITELIFVPNAVSDGLYILNLQIAAIENDASPSKPTLYQLTIEN